jgi:tyrosyl-tRNA synthetase
MASELPPEKWVDQILWPIPQDPRLSIFGHSHIAMARDFEKSLVDALVDCGLSPSKGQARTSVKNNAVMINRVKCNDISRILTNSDSLLNIDAIVIENGRHNFGIIEMCD